MKKIKESLLLMSVHIVLLLLELKWIYNLDDHDPFSSFGVMKVPDNDS